MNEPSVPVRLTLLEEGMLVEVNPGGRNGSVTFVALTPEQIETLKHACPDESDDERWRT